MKVINQSWKKIFTSSNNKVVGDIKFCSIGMPFWYNYDRYGWMEILILRSFQALISPLLGFVFAVRHSRILTKYEDFSVPLQIFKFAVKMFVVAFLVACLFLLSTLLNKTILFDSSTYYGTSAPSGFGLWPILIMFVATSCGAGVGYLFYVRKNYRFIWLAISFVLVIPAVVVFLYILILKAFPSLRKYAPQDTSEKEVV